MSVLSTTVTASFGWAIAGSARMSLGGRAGRRRRQLWTAGVSRGFSGSAPPRRTLEHQDNPDRRYDPLAINEISRQAQQRASN